VSVGKARFIDLRDQHNNREQVIGLENCVTPNVTTLTDLGPLIAIIVCAATAFSIRWLSRKAPTQVSCIS